MPKFRNKILKDQLFKVLRILTALVIAFAVSQMDLKSFEAWTYDLRMRLKPQPEVSNHIATVQVDASTVEFFKGEPKALDHLRVLKKIIQQQPKFVVYLMNLADLEGTPEELKSFATFAHKNTNVIATSKEFRIKGQEDSYKLPGPLSKIETQMSIITRDDINFAKDKVTRRILLSNYGEEFLHHKLALEFNHIDDVNNYHGIFNFLTSKQILINYRKPGTYQPTSFLKINKQGFKTNSFKNKIVLIGRNTVADENDYKQTPFSREVLAMTNLEVNANMIDTLILNNGIARTPKWVNFLFTSIISIITVFSVFILRPLKGLAILASTTFIFLTSAYIAFAFFNTTIGMIQTLLSIFVCYYFFIPYRLIVENKKSWSYQKNNLLLKQVEEMKTNFIRMMSHDLKTPLARIQGMSDLAMRDSNELSKNQKDALKKISQSTEDLSEFITSILDLNRIESDEIKLQLSSKDVNAILKQVITKCEFLARKKNIEIVTEFETLFSVKVDIQLIHQVFTNLIENAIKYSPNDTKILISTEEYNGSIIVQVADQGPGISVEEQSAIFSKFYRCKQATNNPSLKGNGLGLYLSKYFIDLHKGRISVDSQGGLGSTFTVEIPTTAPQGDLHV